MTTMQTTKATQTATPAATAQTITTTQPTHSTTIKNPLRTFFNLFAALVISCVSAITALAKTPAAALESGDRVMSVSPSEQVIELKPGQHYEGTINVTNAGRLAFSLDLSVAPYHVNDDSYDPDFSTDNAYTSLKNWISFPAPESPAAINAESQNSNTANPDADTPQDPAATGQATPLYIIQPGKTVPVIFAVDVPDDAPSGGQYAAIMIENSLLPEDAEQQPSSMVEVQPRAAAVIYAHVEGGALRESASLGEHTLPGFVIGGTVTASATIENDGNVDFYARHTLSVVNFFTGREVVPPAADGINQPFDTTMIILPGTSRASFLNWDLAATSTFPIGLYRLTQTISFLDHEETFERLLFVCPIWFALLIGFIILLGVMWLALSLTNRAKRNRQNASF